MNGDNVARATIRVDADTSQAISALRRVSSELNNLVPGGNAVSSVFERIQGGFLQLIQGLSRNAFRSLSMSMTKLVSSGVNVAKTLEMSRVAFDNLLESGENVDQLLLKIQEDAVKTPFDVDALTLSTQKIALITKNGSQAERTILNLGKALAAAGRGTAEMNRMATNLQQIGQNAKATERDLREFGNAGVDIVGIVTEFSEEFKKSGLEANEARDWLKSIDKPFEVIVNALNAAGESVDGFAKIYEDGAQTIGQAMENMSDSVGIFSYRVMEQAKVLDRAKNVMKEFQDGLFLNKEFTANAAQAIAHLLEVVKEMAIIKPIIKGIQDVVSAFAAGQFDNVIVFFRNLFNAIKQFTGIKVVSNALKVLFDLFSDNHTAEEVAKVATQLGNLVRVFLEIKMMNRISDYAYNLTNSITTAVQALSVLGGSLFSAASAMGTFGKVSLTTIGVVGALISAIAIFSNISGRGIEDVLDSIVSGIRNFLGAIGDAAAKMLEFGWNLIVGLYNGMVQAFNAVIGKIKEIAQNIINAFAQVFQIHSPSKVMRDYIGRNIVEGIAEGIRENYGVAVDAMEEVLEELVKLQDEYVKELGKFGALDLVQQVETYKMFADLYAKGTKARLEMDDKVHDAETAIIKEMIDLIEDFNKAFDSAYKKAKDYYDMFEYTQITLTRTTKSVIEGLHRQNDNMQKYYNNIYKMSQMGFDDDFMSYVYEQGIDAASEVAGLADATAEQIEEINELWRTRGKIATDIAVLNTQKLKEETIEELDYLQTGLDTKALDYYDSGTYLLYNFARGIYDMMPTLEDAMYRVSVETSKSSKAASDAASAIDTAIGEVGLDEVEDFTASAHKMNLELFDTNDIFSFMKNLLSGMPWWVWAGIGVKAVAGVAKGISDFKNRLGGIKNTASTVGNAVSGTWKKVTEITSDWGRTTEKAAGTFIKSGENAAAQMGKTADSVSSGYHKVITETQTAAKKVNDITYSSATKQGENLLKPFKTFNTRVKGFTTSITETIKSFLNIIFDSIKHVLKQIGEVLKTAAKSIIDLAKQIVKGILDIIKTAVKGIMDVLDSAVTGLVKIIKKAAKGAGEALRDLLKPISDTKLLKGVVVLEGLAVVLFTLAKAGQEMDKVSWEGLGKLAAVTAGLLGVAYVMKFLGDAAKEILMGAAAVAAAGAAIGIALAAIGGGLWVLGWSFAELSRFGTKIDMDAIGKIVQAWWLIGTNLAMSLPLQVLGAISGLFAMAEGGELVAIAKCFVEVSDLAKRIKPKNISNLISIIKMVGKELTLSIVQNFIGMFSGAFATVISQELVPIARNLAIVSDLAERIDTKNIKHLTEAISMLGDSLMWTFVQNFIGMFSGAFAEVISNELRTISRNLAYASDESARINVKNLQKIETAISTLASQMMWDLVQNFLSMFSGAFAKIISDELVPIVDNLAYVSEKAEDINIPGIGKIGRALEALRKVNFGSILVNIHKSLSSAPLKEVAGNMVYMIDSVKAICDNLKVIEEVNEQDVETETAKIVKVCEKIAGTFDGNFFLAIGQNWQSSQLEGVVDSVQRVMDKLDELLVQLKRVDRISKTEITEQLQSIKDIMDEFGKMFDGNFFEAIFEKWSGAKIADSAESVKSILDSTLGIIAKLKEVNDAIPKDIDGQCYTVKGYISKVTEVIEAIDEAFNGDWAGAQADKSQAGSLDDTARSLDSILGTTQSMFHKLQEFQREGYTVTGLKPYVDNVGAVAKAIAEVDLGDKSSGTVADMAKKADSLSNMAWNLDNILGHVQSMCHKLQEFGREGYTTAETVKTEIAKVEQIVWRIADISFSQGVDEVADTAKKANSLREMSGYFDELLGNVKKMCESLKAMTDAGYNVGGGNDKDVLGQIRSVEQIVAALAKIDVGQDSNAVSDLASKVTIITEMSGKLNELIETTTTIIESLKKFTEAYAGTTVEEQVRKINEEILAPLMGGEYGDKEYEGIQIPYAAFNEDDVNRLSIVKQCLDQISQIAQTLKTVDDVSQYIMNTEAVIKFITDVMSEIPEKIGGFSEDFKNQGINMAQSFINGWESKIPDGAEIAHSMQDAMWQAIQNRMADETEQGKWLAQSFIDGWTSKVNEKAYDVGHSMQDAIWRGIQDHMVDEWWQGVDISNSVINGIWSKQGDWWWTGDNIIAGIAGGINRNMWQINQAAGNISDTAVERLRKLLRISSPSKVMAELGGYVAEGFAEGINDSLNEVEAAGEALANAVMDGYNEAIEPIDLTAYEARAVADQAAIGAGYSSRSTSVVQNNNIYNNMDMSQALSQIAWEVSRS